MRKWLPALLLLSAVSIFLGVYFGPVSLSLHDVTSSLLYGIELKLSRFTGINPGEKPNYFIIVWQLRLPEVLLAYFVGLALAGAGVTSQALFRNPLADPYIIGISSGAALGSAIAILINPTYMAPFALIFSFLSVFIVYTVSRVDGAVPVDTLLLA